MNYWKKRMSKVQEQTYKQNGKLQTRYYMSIPLEVIKSCALKKGDNLVFNGEQMNELRFKIVRSE